MDMKVTTILLFCMAMIGLTVSCDKDKAPTPAVPVADCLLIEEVLSGGDIKVKYEYDDLGNPSIIRGFNSFDDQTRLFTIYPSNVRVDFKAINGEPAHSTVDYPSSNIFNYPPLLGYQSLTLDGVTQINYQTFVFSYDAKSRLSKVSQRTEYILNDYEYDLTILYNDDDNVRGLQYETATGPVGMAGINVEKYDDKPSPYSGIKGFAFLMTHYTWNNFDPGPIFAALSKNNPLDFTTATYEGGPPQYKRKMEYSYNEKGYPISRKSTNTVEDKEFTFVDTFSYSCK